MARARRVAIWDEVTVRRNARARRMSLRVSSLDGRVTLTLPERARLNEARGFVEDRAGWIARVRETVAPAVQVVPGAALPVEGRLLTVARGRGASARVAGGAVEAPAPPRTGPAVAALLRMIARDRLSEAVERHARTLSVAPARIALRDTRSRWGSCAVSGNLSFSWRLAMAPPWVLDYVAAHEVAHLAHHDHSPRFWRACRALHPETDAARAWLRRHGGALHRYRFGGS